MRNHKTTFSARADFARPEDFDALLDRARREVDAEFHLRTDHAGQVRHNMNPPLEIEEALDPALDWPWWPEPAVRH